MLEMSSADLIGKIFCTISKAECCCLPNKLIIGNNLWLKQLKFYPQSQRQPYQRFSKLDLDSRQLFRRLTSKV